MLISDRSRHHLTTFAVSTATLWLILAAILIIVAALTVLLRYRRQSVWQRFGKRHGLEHDDSVPGMRLSGMIDGRHCVLETADESSDTGPMGVEEVVLKLSFESDEWPELLCVRSAVGLIGDIAASLEEHRVETGDAEFDRDVLVTAKYEEEAANWLTPRRRAALLSIVQAHDDKQMACQPGFVSLQTRSAISRSDELERMLGSLQTGVRQLE
ncbi:MAG: hypothetical protein R3C59_07835 [Planctomycetaceae bacterium]